MDYDAIHLSLKAMGLTNLFDTHRIWGDAKVGERAAWLWPSYHNLLVTSEGHLWAYIRSKKVRDWARATTGLYPEHDEDSHVFWRLKGILGPQPHSLYADALVALAFADSLPAGYYDVQHLDGDLHNLRLDNLKIVPTERSLTPRCIQLHQLDSARASADPYVPSRRAARVQIPPPGELDDLMAKMRRYIQHTWDSSGDLPNADEIAAWVGIPRPFAVLELIDVRHNLSVHGRPYG